ENEEALRRLYELVGTGLYPWELVPCALGLAHLAEGMPMPAMLMGANMGGDTDTLASLAGSICGALQGIGAFDGEMLAQVEAVNSLDLRTLAQRLLALRGFCAERG
ncbi:MAG TPA: ADP-ribosylglycohydrolase family protein, partial [Anaerolineae bacterium]|nr:ADP-ribosylglycohydrolase family protein [Anaerolineae bacterium]